MTEELHIHLCFVRHAETEANSAGIRQGHSDYPLTESGIIGAELLGSALRNTLWDGIMCSDLLRTRRTLAIIQSQRTLAQDNLMEHFNPVVREVNFGIREGLPKDTTVEEAKRIWSEKRGVSVESIEDTAETEAAVLVRQQTFLSELRLALSSSSSSSSCQHTTAAQPARVLCVSHGGFIKRFLSNFTDNIKLDSIPNCSITTVHITYSPEGPGDVTPPPLEGRVGVRAMDVCEVGHLHSQQECLEGGGRDGSRSIVEEYTWPT